VRYVLAAAAQPLEKARPSRLAQLTKRELEVLRPFARGQPIKQMAQHLTISPNIVDSHLRSNPLSKRDVGMDGITWLCCS
jgi:DNA-binding CsgD family transcriptional regulator